VKTSSQQLARAIRAQKKTPRKITKYAVKSGRAPDWSRSDQRRTTGRWEFVQRSA
jgi:hypothetical protein